MPEPGKKGAGPQEENKILKGEVKTLKEELDTTKKGEEEVEVEEQVEEHVLKSLLKLICALGFLLCSVFMI